MSDDRGATASSPKSASFPIAHVHWALPPVTGGVETHLAEFARALAARGHPVTLFTGRGELSGLPGVTTIPCDLLDMERCAERRTRSSDEDLAKQLAAVLGEELVRRKIKDVHGHNLHHFTPIPAMALELLQKELRLRLHHTYHSFWNREDSADADIADICRSWPGQHSGSDYMQDRCETELNIRTVRTHLGVPLDRYDGVAAPAADAADRVLLLPARLMPEKGAEIAIEMLHRLRVEEGLPVRLILTTPGQVVDWKREARLFRAKIEELVASSGLTGAVHYRSSRYDEMPQLYEQADVVIYPSTYPEPLGIAPLEAAAAGRPVIVTRIGGLQETVEDGETGYIVPPGDLAALTSRVRGLLKDPALARRMGEAGRQRVRALFTIDAYADQMIKLYRSTST
jgi:glycosyltransferase involved in cell wall biosynthesis